MKNRWREYFWFRDKKSKADKKKYRQYRKSSGKFRPWTAIFLSLLTPAIGMNLALAQNNFERFSDAWPLTNFEKNTIDFTSIKSGGPPKDGIPSIDSPTFLPPDAVNTIKGDEPVITIEILGHQRAYPLAILLYHEIVNDQIEDFPFVVTYCPLCNASRVFDRRLGNEVLEFGTTGLLRYSDLVMYDRQSESWWQQFLGEAIVGAHAGAKLKPLPARIESLDAFAARAPNGEVLAPPPVLRSYGTNPYIGYDSSSWPFLYDGTYDGPIPPLAYVVAIGDQAWPLDQIRESGTITYADIKINWTGQARSVLDKRQIKEARLIDTVSVTRHGEPFPFDTPFAFAFKAFYPDGIIHVEESPEP